MESGLHVLGFTVDDYQMALKTVRLEKELQDAFGKTAQILGTEETRMKRVEQLFVLFDNEDLRLQLDKANLKLSKALKAESEVRFQLHVACDELNHLRSASFASSKEIKDLENKLASLANINADYQKLVAENVHLSKDLARIQLEVEAFRVQQSGSFVPLTDKRELERQLHSLESQMAIERQIHERTLTRESQQAKEIASLNVRLEEQGRRLAKEAQARNCCEQEIRQQDLAWTAQPLSGEKRPDPSSRKALSTKDVSQVGSDDKLWTHGVNDVEPGKSVHQTHPNPQQPVSKFHTELTIATPGAIHTRERKRKPSALPGDKSSFSITPFLNRTSGIPESPISSDGSDELHASQAHAERDTLYSKASLIQDRVDPQRRDQPRLANKSIARLAQRQPSEPPSSTTNVKPKANQRPSNKSDTEGSAGGAFAIANNLSTQTQSRPKKRKLGAQRDKNLLDGDDEGDDFQDMRKPVRKFASGSTTGRNAGLDLGPSLAQTGSHLSKNRGFGGFSDFSPLKRDKRRQ